MRNRTLILAAAIGTLALAGHLPAAAGRAFYADDPIAVDPETEDAAAVSAWTISDQYDFVENSFLGAGDRTSRRAVNVNTVDEVPNSSWFTNRMAARPMTVAEITKGPDRGTGPAGGSWTIVSGKSEGITPGMTITDAAGDRYFVKFDPPSNPEMATGAEIISTKFFYALGFEVPENYLATFRRESLRIGEGAAFTASDGRKRPIEPADVDALLEKAARNLDGSYRAIVSKMLSGRPLGPFRYYGTRPDDPNDIFPHEHRRELRGLRVFSAWLNHDDSRSINSLDTLVDRDGRSRVQHHLIDFGSTLGSGSVTAQKPRAGNEYIWEGRPTLVTMLTLGLYVRPWIKVDYPELPAVGRIEADFFQPDRWKPEYPNPAFLNMRPDDGFWAARRVAAFSDETIRAIVHTATFADPAAERYLTDVIIKRRDKVCRFWLNGVNPLVDFAMDPAGVVSFENAAVVAGAATPASAYRIRWARFDNATGDAKVVGEDVTTTERRVQAPDGLLAREIVSLDVRATHPDHPAWSEPVRVYFRRSGSGWKTIGLERSPGDRQ